MSNLVQTLKVKAQPWKEQIGAFFKKAVSLMKKRVIDKNSELFVMHRFIDTSFSLTNSAQESTFARFKYFKNQFPNMRPENLESLTLWNNNKLQEWLIEKSRDERYDLIHKARSLTNMIKEMHSENDLKAKNDQELEFNRIREERNLDDRLSMRHCNTISLHRNTLFPLKSDCLEQARKRFNKKENLPTNNKIYYLSALSRHFNSTYSTAIRGPKELGMTIGKTEAQIKLFLDEV